ncbi:hypothetical protein PR048_018046 [Dryococelus australis]|uniref:Uncharacterized protein n=1 Tax=Dryococelus australis TaxID=614101 RepID=A0ABQ9HB61_9NEOP|nr:hypothetical protein PR048_018046 [Dryococelus australis]
MNNVMGNNCWKIQINPCCTVVFQRDVLHLAPTCGGEEQRGNSNEIHHSENSEIENHTVNSAQPSAPSAAKPNAHMTTGAHVREGVLADTDTADVFAIRPESGMQHTSSCDRQECVTTPQMG